MNCRLLLILLTGMAFAQVPSSGTSAPPAAALPSSPATAQPDAPVDATALLPEPAPLPDGKASLIGGTIRNLDRLRDQITVQIFGGKTMRVLFDGRTRVYRDEAAASFRDLEKGQRVYLDTQLDGTKIFARNIRVVTHTASGESSGQVLGYESSKGELTLRDSISPQPIKLRITTDTKIQNGDRAIPITELRPGSLISVKLNPDGAGRGIAREISVLAMPGTAFTFAGRVTYLDMHNGLLVLVDPRDKKRYDVHFDPAVLHLGTDVREGADVNVITDFDGSRYLANSITVTSPANDEAR